MALPQTDAHIEAQRRLREIVKQAVAASWVALGAWNEADVERFLAVAVPTVLAGQRAAVSLTDSYVADVLGRPPLGLDASDLVGAAVRNGTAPETVYQRPFVTLWGAMGQGRSFDDGFSSALARLRSSAAMDMQLSMRAASQAIEAQDEGIYGYQRVADGDACMFCQEVDGAYVKSADAMPLHNNCGCGLEPLIEAHPRAVFLPDGTRIRNYQHGPLIDTPPPETVAVHEHGELGPVLADPNQHFTTEAEALS